MTAALMLLAALVPACAGGAAEAGYPSPQDAGFHHCALVYDRAERGAAQLMPFVAREQGGRSREWLFDAFLFLVFTSPRGIDTSTGPTQRTDWQYQLDRWFAPGRDLAALDAAAERAAADLGAPPVPRQVILTIPYVNPAVKDFGDVGRGRSEDLSTAGGRSAVLAWYLGEARRRFAAAGFRHLRLWGFYWMREDAGPGDAPAIGEAARLAHEASLRFLWIPWFRAAGWDRWRDFGFDVAIMQPNYAFWQQHHGRVRRSRLAVNADLARGAGLGVEVEAGSVTTSVEERRAFLQYLADGAPGRLGYQTGATAYYLGDDTVERMLASPDADVRACYDALAAYVAGRAVPDPDESLQWSTGERGSGTGSDYLAGGRPLATATARLPVPRAVGAVDVYLEDPAGRAPWVGTVKVEARARGSGRWAPAGWAVRTRADAAAGRWQVVTVPVARTVGGLRISFHPMAGAGRPRVRGIAAFPGDLARVRPHRALGRPYRFRPEPPAAYPDTGRRLNDGVVPPDGFASGQTVGWYGTRAAVCFDLGRVARVSRVEVACQGGGYAAVNWPASAAAALAASGPAPTALSAAGAAPADVQWVLPGPLTVDRRRAGDDQDGHLAFTPSRPVAARYVNVLLDSDGWLMLSEVRIFAGGGNIAPSAAYQLVPGPTPATGPQTGPKYPDDGARLTDGIVADGFSPAEVTGWEDDAPREITVDLGASGPVRSVTAWCLGGGLHGIYAPAAVDVSASADGRDWQSFGSAPAAPRSEDGKECERAAYRVEAAGVQARYVRVRVRRARGWAMISEIEVQ